MSKNLSVGLIWILGCLGGCIKAQTQTSKQKSIGTDPSPNTEVECGSIQVTNSFKNINQYEQFVSNI
jgi:hypothetical protein